MKKSVLIAIIILIVASVTVYFVLRDDITIETSPDMEGEMNLSGGQELPEDYERENESLPEGYGITPIDE
jgi:hypothetical protein